MSFAAIAPGESIRKSGDTFATGVMVMLLLNLVQRLIGLLRGLGFCHFLSDVELGQWALVNSFLMIGVPIAVLGLPGSFGRFVETFRSRNQLGDYFRRVLAASACGLTIACTAILIFPQQFSWLLFRETTSYGLVVWCVVTLISLTVYSFVHELVASVREMRAVSLMQFTQSVVFGVVGLSVLSIRPSWSMLLPSFTIACLFATLPGLVVLLSSYRCEFRPTPHAGQFDGRALWARILPYAVALWVMNLLSNLFEVSDRYMLLHLIPGAEQVGQAMVGQYHCGRILPNLLTSIALMLGGVLLPYISADWEAGQPQRIAARLRQIMQSVSIGFTLLAIAGMCVAPLLFHYGFHNRYQQAEAILPISMTQAIWVSLFIVAQSYLLCIERGKRLAALMVTGLLLNLVLNWWLIQQLGLFGAVLATSTANLFTLLLLLWQMSRHGCSLGWGTLALCLTPLSVAAGPVVATITLLIIVAIAGRTSWLLSPNDRQQIDSAILPKLERLGIRLRTLWP
ncbi:MAG: lipopolysaccharide biosynthesis protein [Pirellulaceae bacterium]